MDIAAQLTEAVQQTTAEHRSTARSFQNAIEEILRRKGWRVLREFSVPDRGDGVPGRIDLVVTNPVRVAIELDNAIIRKKSLFKLSRFDGFAFVILRKTARIVPCPQSAAVPPGHLSMRTCP